MSQLYLMTVLILFELFIDVAQVWVLLAIFGYGRGRDTIVFGSTVLGEFF